MIYIGIDPGVSGATAFIVEGRMPWAVKHNETPHDILEVLTDALKDDSAFALIEKVHAMPRQGVKSMFTFGQSFGMSIGFLTALRIPYEMVSPGKWQREMQCLTKGDKNVTKSRAQELFPQLKVTHATADALLLAEYCRRGRF